MQMFMFVWGERPDAVFHEKEHTSPRYSRAAYLNVSSQEVTRHHQPVPPLEEIAGEGCRRAKWI